MLTFDMLGNPSTFYPSLRKATKSTIANILLNYFLSNGADKDWVEGNLKHVLAQTGLSIQELKEARTELLQLNIIEVKIGKPNSYKILMAVLYNRLSTENNDIKDEFVEFDDKQIIPSEETHNMIWLSEEPAYEYVDDYPKYFKKKTTAKKIYKPKEIDEIPIEEINSRRKILQRIKSQIETKLGILAVGTRWEKFITFCYNREVVYGEKVSVYLDWAVSEGFNPVYWTPEKMATTYPRAFAKKKETVNTVSRAKPFIREKKDVVEMPGNIKVGRKLY